MRLSILVGALTLTVGTAYQAPKVVSNRAIRRPDRVLNLQRQWRQVPQRHNSPRCHARQLSPCCIRVSLEPDLGGNNESTSLRPMRIRETPVSPLRTYTRTGLLLLVGPQATAGKTGEMCKQFLGLDDNCLGEIVPDSPPEQPERVRDVLDRLCREPEA